MVRTYFIKVLVSLKKTNLNLFVCTIFICTILLYIQDPAGEISGGDSCISTDIPISVDSPSIKIRIMCVGDIMTHFPLLKAAKVKNNRGYDFSSSLEIVSPLLKKADIVIGNLETVLGGDTCGLSGYPTFNGPQILAVDLKTAGFTVLTTANNHSFDKSVIGLKNTIKLLDSLGISHTGTFADTETSERSLLLPVKGHLIGIISYTYGTNGPLSKMARKYINIIDTFCIKEDIKKLRDKKVDIIIASIHFGFENMMYPSKEQKNIVSLLWRNGVSIVFGHHTHILQPAVLDTASNRFIIFSLGNFMTNQIGNNREYGGIADITIEKSITDSLFKIVTALVHPTCMYQWSENSHTRYSVLLLEELWEKRLPSQYPGRMLKIADTLPFLNNHLHILDRRFKYVEKQTKHSPDCRR
jgi:poly-gamma-glutamate synthesis protein (capsule biosynthesis protein)